MDGTGKHGEFTGEVKKMPQFILKINLGNDAMYTSGDIAKKLEEIAMSIPVMHGDEFVIPRQRLRDDNGNSVGYYEVVP